MLSALPIDLSIPWGSSHPIALPPSKSNEWVARFIITKAHNSSTFEMLNEVGVRSRTRFNKESVKNDNKLMKNGL
jgi:hypothetical protein